MYKDSCICIVCKEKINFDVRNKINEGEGEIYSIIEKNNDGSFNCEVIVKCKKCKAKQKIIRDITFYVEESDNTK